MCQSISEGGRRCPAHRHDTRSVLQLVRNTEPGYGPELYHAAFLDLRRTNRGNSDNMSSGSEDSLRRIVSDALLGENADSHASDVTTLTSQATLLERGVVSEEADAAIVAAVNAPTDEMSRKVFDYVYRRQDQIAYEPSPQELELAKESLGNEGWIHHDPKAVSALAILKSRFMHDRIPGVVEEEEPQPRIAALTGVASRYSPVLRAGYDPETATQSSRLELVLRDSLDTRLVYQNVDEGQWLDIARAGVTAAVALEEIRNNPDCRYESAEAAEAAGLSEDRSVHAERCADCGQFTGATSHACPAFTVDGSLLANAGVESPEPEIEHVEIEGSQSGPAATISSSDRETTEPAVVSSPEEMVYPTSAGLLERTGYTAVVINGTRPSNMNRIADFSRREIEALIAQGEITEADRNSTDMLLYTSVYGSRPDGSYGRTYTVLGRVPSAESSRYSIIEYKIFERSPGRSLEQDRTWSEEYGSIPEGAVEVGQNTTRSTALAPVESTSRLMSLAVSYSHTPDNDVQVELGREQRGDRDKWVFGRARDVRSNLENGETVVVPFSHEYDGSSYAYSRTSFVDADGWEIKPGTYGNTSLITSGKVALKKDENGVVRVVGVTDLHCNQCRNNNCSHTGYSVRQSAYVGQSLLTPRAGATTNGTRRAPNPETGLPVSLESLCTVSRNEDGERTITFTQVGTVQRRTATSRLNTAVDTQSDPEIFRTNTAAPNATHITRAVRNAAVGESVVVPIQVRLTAQGHTNYRLGSYVNDAIVLGTITYGRDDEGNPIVRERSLRCQCEVYSRNYSCRHTRRVQAGEMNLMGSVAEQEAIENTVLSYDELERLNNMVAVQDREAALGRDISQEKASRLATADIDNYEERNRIRIAEERAAREAREEARRLARLAAAEEERRADLAAFAGYAEQREKMVAKYAAFEGTRYSEDYDAFEAEAKLVRDKVAAGEDPLTYVTTDALNGIGDDIEHGRKFGVELEVVFPDSYSGKDEVARALAQAGLAENAYVGHYHSGRRAGWDKWTAENDCTVDLEVVSPIMNDTPENWAQLQKVCDIIKEKGGSVNYQTGSHVHISTGDYGKSVATHAALLDEFSRYSDILYRLGSNPETKTHRGTEWCSPNTVQAGRVVAAADDPYNQVAYYLGAPHSSAINFEASGSGNKSHAEVRLWDGSLNHNVIQMQVMLTAAMTEVAAQRVNREDEDKFTYSDESEQLPLGASKDKRFESKKEETAKFREMIDRYFPRESDRKRFIALWETTKWQSRRRRGY